jgi:hypothetical protein
VIAPYGDHVRKRDVVDHALARRALLASLHGGGLFATTSTDDICDAGHFLKSAAQAYGVHTARPCPVCRSERLWEVAWVYGESLGGLSGTARNLRQVERLAQAHADFAVHEVEVCRGCGWNHLVRSFRTGTGAPPGPDTPPRRRRREAL